MPNIWLYAGEATPNNVKLTDPTVQRSSGSVDVTVNVTGVSATGSLGSVVVTAAASYTVTGQQATAAIGSVTVTAAASTSPVGVAATGAIGSAVVTADANTSPAGVAGAGQIGDVAVEISGSISVDVAGVEATGQVGSVTVTTGEVPQEINWGLAYRPTIRKKTRPTWEVDCIVSITVPPPASAHAGRVAVEIGQDENEIEAEMLLLLVA